MKRWFLLIISSGLLLTAQADDRQLSKLQYWFDDNQSAMVEQTLRGTKQTIDQAIDVSGLREGMHNLYYRIGDDVGQWSPLHVWTFFVASIRNLGEKEITAAEYWIDQNIVDRKTVEVSDGIWQQALNVSNLSEGIHTLNYRFVDNYGLCSPLQTWAFFVAPIRNQGAKTIKAAEYWIDQIIADRKTTEVSGDIWQQALDVSGLSEGIHTLNYRFVDNYGDYSAVSQTMFSKVQKKTTQIKKLRYWWSNRTDMIEEVEADQPSFTYESLLKVPQYARQDGLTDKGVARFNCVAVDDQGRQSASFYEDIIYGTGPELTADKYTTTAGSDVKLSWTYTDANGIKDFIVYYSKDNSPFVMYIPSTNETSIEFKGAKGFYRFLVVVRNNNGQRTSMDDEWSVIVIFE